MAFATYKAAFIQAGANVANSAGPRIHTYKSDDAHGVLDGSGYFDDIADLLKIGDLIYHCEVTDFGASNEAVADAQFLVVVTITASGVVHVSGETAIVITLA